MLIARDDHGQTLVNSGDGWFASPTPVAEIVAGREPSTGPRQDHPTFAVPIQPGTIYGIGLNFSDTVAEMGWDTPQAPYLFPKLVSSITGPSDPIVVDESVTAAVDWEGELAVVIGRTAKNVPTDQALRVVFGYLAANDVSARDLQAADGQWVRGKGLDTFCPLGPWIVTADQVDDPQDVPIKTTVNGRVVQNGSTATMIFTVAELVSYCSRWFTLSPGDIILTGTPAGCGSFQEPPVTLQIGDIVEVEVGQPGLFGQLRNRVVSAGVVTD